VVVGWLAGASLWIYLLHWQVYPHLEDDVPALATVLSLLVGVLAWQAWERAARRLRECVPTRRG
jgi:peptidoglycan/LPS O-acetylase OafA/YrhL